MEFTIKSDLDPVALMAIVLAAFSLSWQVVTHLRSGARLRLSVMTDMVHLEDALEKKDGDARKIVNVSVSNFGDQPTTITGFYIHHWPSRRAYLTRKKGEVYFFRPTLGHFTLPSKLNSGDMWWAYDFLGEKAQEILRGRFAYVVIDHSASKRSKRVRLKFQARKSKKTTV